jgi:uncharacterized membrane protein YbhN (UPF0104 family)
LVISVACWLLDGTIFFLMSLAVGASLGWTECLLIAGVTVLGTAIPSAPGYVGTFELAAVAAGVALGLPSDSVLAVAVLVHALTTGMLVVGGIGVLLTAPLSGFIGRAQRSPTGGGPGS